MSNRPGYKHTQIGWIPTDWDVTKLSKMVERSICYGVVQPGEDDLQGIKFIRGGDIVDGTISKDVRIISKKVADQYKRTYLRGGELLISLVGYPGETAIVPNEYIGANIARQVGLVDLKNADIAIWAHYYISSPIGKRELLFESFGSAQQVINIEQLNEFTIPIPPLIELRKICSILSTWDEAVTKTQQLITQLQQRNKGLMQQLLTGKKRLKGFNSEWKRLHIYNVAKEVSLKNRDDKQLIVLSCTKYDGLVPSLEYFGRRVFGSDTTTYKVVPLHHFAYATNHIEEGSIGYQSIFEEALISPMYTVFKTDSQVHDDYLFKLLKSHHYIHEYCKRMEGSIDRRGGLRWDEFSKIVIHLPEIDEQIAIATLLNKAVAEEKLYKQKLSMLQQQKKGLMQKLLTGEIRVKIEE
jgi:type I restriction enzyme S subunit